MKSPGLAFMYSIVLAMLLSCFNGHTLIDEPPPPPASSEEIDTVRDYLRKAREALPRVPENKRQAFEQAVTRAEQAVESYASLTNQGATGRKVKGTMMVAGGFMLGNDATGVGVADDVFLPFLAVALLAVHLTARSPATSSQLTESWSQMIDAMDDVGRVASIDIIAHISATSIPPRDQCTAHYSMCLGTRLGKRNTGGVWGRSICQDCLEKCQGQSEWPPTTGDGKDCHWWNHL